MDGIAHPILKQTVQDTLTSGLSFLVSHNVKGAKLLQDSLTKAEDIIQHNNILKQVLMLLAPIFKLASDAVVAWLAGNYAYLVPVYEWAKDEIISLFGLI
jgi:hypothetical protein